MTKYPYIVTDKSGNEVRPGDLRALFGICPIGNCVVKNAGGNNAKFSESDSEPKIPFERGEKIIVKDGLKVFVKQQVFQFEIPKLSESPARATV